MMRQTKEILEWLKSSEGQYGNDLLTWALVFSDRLEELGETETAVTLRELTRTGEFSSMAVWGWVCGTRRELEFMAKWMGDMERMTKRSAEDRRVVMPTGFLINSI